MDICAEYAALIDAITGRRWPDPVMACATSACLDVVVDLADISRAPEIPPEAAPLIALLRDRAMRGVGGEIVHDWQGAVDWVRTQLPHDLAWGGTGPHAAMALAALGARALVALNDRSATTLSVIPDGVLMACPSGLVARQDMQPEGGLRNSVLIFEYTKDVPVLDGVIPPRSSRVIVRIGDLGIERDSSFHDLIATGRVQVAAGLLGGFQCVAQAELEQEFDRLRELSGRMRACGAAVIHLELAGYRRPEQVAHVLSSMRDAITSVGMSESEFRFFFDCAPSAAPMRRIAADFGLRRLCVHADRWAASVTQDDPAAERNALMLGSLLAATRAERGRAGLPRQVPDKAVLTPPDIGNSHADDSGYAVAAVPTLYLNQPRTTLGMGDTFAAGCLLALSEADLSGPLAGQRGKEMDAVGQASEFGRHLQRRKTR